MQNLFALVLLLSSLPAVAWDQHQSMMDLMLESDGVASRAYLKEVVTIPSEADQKKEIETLSKSLQVNPEKIAIQKPGKTTVIDFIRGETVDEPDFGMDQDLADDVDPNGDRAWMGGKTGPTSQGFRHMFFNGIEWGSPLRTLQIPTRTIGQTPDRIEKIRAISQKYFSEKNRYWGLRTLLWEIHLLQDLHQPFHVMQVPYFKMLPWKNLFSGFVGRSIQVIANYHYAYEGFIRESVDESVLSELVPCFAVDAQPVQVKTDTMEIMHLARKSAENIGIPLYRLWDDTMKNPDVNLPEGIGGVDYYSYLHASAEEEGQKEKVESVQALLKETCGLIKHLTVVTFSELDQALKP